VSRKVELDYSRLGLKRGVIFVYLKDGDASEVAQQVASMEGVVSVSVQIGNADVLGFLAYKDSRQLFELTSGVRKMEGVDRVLWSEEMYSRSSSSNPTAFASILCWARH
jgi:hypothetical protein